MPGHEAKTDLSLPPPLPEVRPAITETFAESLKEQREDPDNAPTLRAFCIGKPDLSIHALRLWPQPGARTRNTSQLLAAFALSSTLPSSRVARATTLSRTQMYQLPSTGSTSIARLSTDLSAHGADLRQIHQTIKATAPNTRNNGRQ